MNNTTSRYNFAFPRYHAGWGFTSMWSLVLLILIIINNSLLLTFILSRKQLRTPFSVYVVNLLLANIVMHGVTNAQMVMQNYYGKWPFNGPACGFYLYAAACIGAGVMASHVVIAANRICAIVFPIPYKNHHTTKKAIAICIGVWIYCHVMTLPSYITDELARPAVVGYFCFFHSEQKPIWNRAFSFLTHQFNEILVIVAYPVTLVLYWRKLRKNRVNNAGQGNEDTANTRRENRLKHALIVLTTVTFSIVLFWTPLVTYGYWKPALKLDAATSFKYQEAVLAVYTLQPATDPIVLMFALRDVWEELKKQVQKWRVKGSPR